MDKIIPRFINSYFIYQMQKSNQKTLDEVIAFNNSQEFEGNCYKHSSNVKF